MVVLPPYFLIPVAESASRFCLDIATLFHCTEVSSSYSIYMGLVKVLSSVTHSNAKLQR